MAALIVLHFDGHREGGPCWHFDAFECAHIALFGGTFRNIERKRLA